MPIWIDRKKPLPGDVAGVTKFLVDGLDAIASYLKSLVTLDRDVRQTRSEGAERALAFVSATVASGTVVRLADLWPQVVNQVYTTALVQFDTTSGLGRWRMDGGTVIAAAGPASGMPIPTGFSTLTIVGALNIRSFQVAPEGATALTMSITLFQ